jgi:hypothetical protein
MTALFTKLQTTGIILLKAFGNQLVWLFSWSTKLGNDEDQRGLGFTGLLRVLGSTCSSFVRRSRQLLKTALCSSKMLQTPAKS